MIEGLIRVMGLEKERYLLTWKKLKYNLKLYSNYFEKKEKSFKKNSKILMVAFGGVCLEHMFSKKLNSFFRYNHFTILRSVSDSIRVIKVLKTIREN